MAERKKYVTLYNPDHGTEVEVDENRAETLKSRGYTTKRARSYGNSNRRTTGGTAADTSDLQRQLDEANARAEAAEKALAEKSADS